MGLGEPAGAAPTGTRRRWRSSRDPATSSGVTTRSPSCSSCPTRTGRRPRRRRCRRPLRARSSRTARARCAPGGDGARRSGSPRRSTERAQSASPSSVVLARSPDSVLDRVMPCRPDVVVDRIGGRGPVRDLAPAALATRPAATTARDGRTWPPVASASRTPSCSAPAARLLPSLPHATRCHPAPTVSEAVRLGVDQGVVVVGGEHAIASGDVPCA